MKSLHDFAIWRNKTPVIKIQDEKYLNNSKNEMPDKLLSGKELRPYQEEAVESFVNRKKIGILEITTGGGKSLIMTEIIRRLNLKTLVVIDKRELLYQLKNTLEENLGFDIGIIGDGKKEIKNVTVATIQTINKNINEYKEYLGEVRVLCLDEVHKAAAKSYFNLGHYMSNTEYRVGFSGTGFRDDGNDMMMNAVVGNIIYSLRGQELIEKGYLMNPNIIFLKLNISNDYIKEMELLSNNGLINSEEQYSDFYPNFIVNNKYRNKVIIELCEEHNDKQILILVKHIEHGKLLESTIKNSKYVYGETPKKIRDNTVEDFKNGKLNILISTISIFAEGVDIPNLNIIINTSANRGDIKSLQALGRVLRKTENKDTAMYYDFYDTYGFFINASKDRVKVFRKEGYDVEILNKDFEK
jgi:superfamily II DNA or RNA helicase